MKTNTSLGMGLLALCTIVLLAGCTGGGGGGSSGGGGNGGGGGGGGGGGSTTTVTGSIFAGPTAGATVVVLDGATEVARSSTASDADGRFQIAIPDTELGKDLRFETIGGAFTDEASGIAGVVCGELAAFVPANALSAGSAVHLTPASTIVAGAVKSGMSFVGAVEAFEEAFGFEHDSSVGPALDSAAGANEDSLRAGLRTAAFSQLILDLGFAPEKQFDLYWLLGVDLTDGALDGRYTDVPLSLSGLELPEDIRNHFVGALTSFRASGGNKTGILPNQLGTLPFSTVALSDSYRVEYVADRQAVQGRSEFLLKVTQLSDGSPATGLSLSVTPKMYMSDRAHSTPVDGDLAELEGEPGTYSGSIYYLMSTLSATGISMGYWELKVDVGGETVSFYPDVAVPEETDTARAVLYGTADLAASMTGPTPRRYFLFNDGLTGDPGSQALQLFVAAFDTMMSWPAVEAGSTVLHDSTNADWPVDAVVLEFSTDGTNWASAEDLGGGHWSFSGLALTAGTADDIYVRLTINGEVKRTDADPTKGTDYATFTVTP